MSRKPVVYVSSTYEDLKPHRSAVKKALERSQFEVECMEKYPAFDQRPLDKCLADVARADVYILIVAHRYGYRPDTGNPDRKSITHLEYDEARRDGAKPCFVFIVDPDHAWSPKWMDSSNERHEDARDLRSFVKHLQSEHGRSAFQGPLSLASSVQSALHTWRSQRDNALQDEVKRNYSERWSAGEMKFGAHATVAFASLQPALGQPLHIESIHHYSSAALAVVGRESEQQQLLAFASDRAGFLWMQLAGVGGQGKSRLGLELWRSLENEGWRCGLLEAETLESFQNQWSQWQPDRPHLLIADYILGREKQLKPVIQLLAKRQRLRFPVRLLLLERQRWDRGGLSLSMGVREKEQRENEQGEKEHALNSTTEEGRAEWFLKLTTRHDGNDPEVMKCRFQSGVIELRALGQQELIALVRKAGDAVGSPVVASDEAIAKQLRQVDPAGRPLYAYFLGQVLGARPSAKLSSNQELLTEVLNKDWGRRWGAAFKGGPPSIGQDIPAMRLAVLATILRGVDAAALIRQRLLTQKTGGVLVRKQAMVLTDGPLGGGAQGPGPFITPLEPDLLGEWFVLSAFSLGLPMDLLMSLSWRAEASSTALFLERIAQDFGAHPITKELLHFDPASAEARVALSKKAAGILAGLYSAQVEYPKSIVDAVARAAHDGDARAMASLAHCYLSGAGVAADEAQGFAWYQRSAAAGDGSGMRNLGVCYLYGTGVAKNEAAGAEWFRRGASSGDSRSMVNLGWCFMNGVGVEQDQAEAARWYRKAVGAGDIEAMRALGLSYEAGTGVDKDEAEAVRWYRKAVEAGDVMAMRYLGINYDQGIGVPKDDAEAARWYGKAADAGDAEAMRLLGHRYERGGGVVKDEIEAVRWYRKAIDGGDAAALRSLGFAYQRGCGVERDAAEAVRCYRKGIDAGDSGAMRFLGFCYEQGIGLEADPAEAVRWYRKAVDAGDVESILRVGRCYQRGIGVEEDAEEAVRWYRKAIEAGDIEAMRWLGFAHQYGTGVTKDESEAMRWYRKAAESGDVDAMCILGLAYQQGVDAERDELEGVRWLRKAVEAGSASAMRHLGSAYERGAGVHKDEAEAVRWYRQAIEHGDVDATRFLGVMYQHGLGVEKNEVEAVRWYRKAADAGDVVAMRFIGFCHELGLGVEKDGVESTRWYRKAIDQGDGESMTLLGTNYDRGVGVEKDAVEAVRWYRRAIDAGHVPAMRLLGLSYEHGSGVAKDAGEAVRWYRKAAEAGDLAAMRSLGLMYQNGHGVQRDETEAVRCYRNAAEGGDAASARFVGIVYGRGIGVEKDAVESVRWYRKAIEAGDVVAMSLLGLNYEHGIGVAKDEAEAVRWYRKATEKGDAEAMRFLAVSYENGIGVEKDEAEATHWYRKAIEAGDVTAMRFLGLNYERGVGVEKDPVQAVHWYREAVQGGDVEAMRYVGMNYAGGIGVEKDEAEAVRWYHRAVKGGDVPAMRLLGLTCQYGIGVDKDEAEAVRWYRQASEAGDTASMRLLGLCLQFGVGVVRNWDEATRWFWAAVESGDNAARPMLYTCAAHQALVRGGAPVRPRSEGWADSHASRLGSAWIDVPLVQLAWRDLLGTDLDTRRLLSHIHEAFEMRREISRLDDVVCEAMRAAPLPFYPGCQLVELQLAWPEQPAKSAAVVAAVCLEDGAVLLDGDAAMIHAINEYRLNLSDATVTPEYLRFFCAFTHGEDDCPFYLPASVNEIPLSRPAADVLPIDVLNADFTIERLESDVGVQTSEQGFRAFVCYSDGLYRSTFKVAPSGAVQMESDEGVALALPIMQRGFDGPFRSQPSGT